MTDPTPSPVASWKDALVRWRADAFGDLVLPSASERPAVLNEWVFNYTFQLMRTALDGVRVDKAPQDIPAASLDEVHASAAAALVRLAHQVPVSTLRDVLDRTETLWERTRDVVRQTLSAPRLQRIALDATADARLAVSLPGFDTAWPSSLPPSLLDVLDNPGMGSRLTARREAREPAGPSTRPALRA